MAWLRGLLPTFLVAGLGGKKSRLDRGSSLLHLGLSCGLLIP